MAMKPPHVTDRRWRCGVLVGLFIALTAWTSAWPLRPLEARLPVTVREGQLSVNLRAAPVREVLAAISQQTGLRVRVDASVNGTVDAQFMNMALDQGLRRLLRAAALSYSLLYAPGPAATDILHEVRVFGGGRGDAPAPYDGALPERVPQATARRTTPPSAAQAEPEQDVEPALAEAEPDGDAQD